jgi:hypothetical protein
MVKKLDLIEAYNTFKKAGKADLLADDTRAALATLFDLGAELVAEATPEDLTSLVDGKEYCWYALVGRTSRPVNKGLFSPNADLLSRLLESPSAVAASGDCAPAEITTCLYSAVVQVCVAIDLLSPSQKRVGTVFEYICAYLFARMTGVHPENSMPLLALEDEGTRLPTDFVFDLGSEKPKYHMPVKTSTRERAIMLWAHQRLLDGVYGIERFLGVPLLFAETKTDQKKRETVEICTPEQWVLYQTYIAKLHAIYYFDVPAANAALAGAWPPVEVREIGQFFFDWGELLPT